MTHRAPWAMALACLALCAGCAAPLIDETPRPGEGDAVRLNALIGLAPAPGADFADWLRGRRELLQQGRRVAQERFDTQEKACWRRFAVNDCVRAARLERRATMDELREEELALNDLERRRRTASRLQQLEQKARPAE